MKRVQIGDKFVSEHDPCFIVLEAGATHSGLDAARKLVDVAVESKADAVKFQILDPERLIGQKDVELSYKVLVNKETGNWQERKEPLIEILKRRQMSRDEWVALKRYCDGHGIIFFATVDFPESVDFVAALGCHAIKLASADVNHYPLIRYAAKTMIPLMLDTGSSTLGEIEKAVNIINECGNDDIIIHHCPSGYPARLESINLRVITTLRQMFDCPIAFSDHTPGWDMDIAAVALGVSMVEKTITLDRTTKSCEHIMSLEPSEVGKFVSMIRDLEIALGNKRRLMGEQETQTKKKVRRSIFLKEDVAAGDVLTEDIIDFRRPGYGITPDVYHLALGRKFSKAIQKGTMITWEDLR